MAECPICEKQMKLNIDTLVKPVDCPHCDSGPFTITRSSGYLFAFGLILYFIFVVIVGVLMLGVDPDAMFMHNSASRASSSSDALAGIIFFAGFFLWVKVWGDIWSNKWAQFKD